MFVINAIIMEQYTHRPDDTGRVSAEVAGYAQRPVIQSQFTTPPQESLTNRGTSPWGAKPQ